MSECEGSTVFTAPPVHFSAIAAASLSSVLSNIAIRSAAVLFINLIPKRFSAALSISFSTSFLTTRTVVCLSFAFGLGGPDVVGPEGFKHR